MTNTSKKSKTSHSDIAALSFEAALQELENIVKRLETGQVTLDNTLEDYERGNALRKHCAKKLKEAQLKVEKIIAKEDGSLSTTDANLG